MTGRLPLAPVLLAAAVTLACGSSSPSATPTPREIPDCETGYVPPPSSMASEPDIGEFLSFDARAVCSGSVGNVTDTVTGAYVQVIVDEITSGDGLAVGDELAIWTTVSLTGAPGQRLLKGTNFHFEAEWKELSCFGPCPGMVSHEETNID